MNTQLPTRPEAWKLQWPILSNDPRTPILIYNEDRSITVEIPKSEMPAEILPHLRSVTKLYVMGYINEDKKLVLDEVLVDQGW